VTFASPSAPIAILDTNVVLDWLVFRNPECDALGAAVTDGTVRWTATAAMRAELVHVLVRGHLDRWAPDAGLIWSHWERLCLETPAPDPGAPTGRLRCSDPADQKFVDLAVACSARWLVSRDRAVLELARRLRERGVEALAPGRWALDASV
jgi:uncharacterized protein